ncbi:hypothetical protein BgiBS90_004048 [Biomphalaria glabrata]|nr:hypothetical protein BgiBS90_004048 [Biomphalaria glabrata]
MSEVFWLPISLLVVIAAVPLGKQDFELDGKKVTWKHEGLPYPHRRNAFLGMSVHNLVFYGDDQRTPQDFVTEPSKMNNDSAFRNDSELFAEVLQNASEHGESYRRLNSWIYLTYQMYKYQEISFHSPQFVADLKRHISRSSLEGVDKRYGNGEKYIYHKQKFSRSDKMRSLRIYKQKKPNNSNFTSAQKAAKSGKKSGIQTNFLTQNNEPEVETRKPDQFVSCEHVTGYNTHRWLEMVVRCPGNWTQDNVRTQCETWNDLVMPSFSFLPFLPVQDEGGKVYANVFCATCHGVVSLLPWTSKVVCEIYEQSSAVALVNAASTTFLAEYLRAPHCKREVVPSLPDNIVSCKVHSPEQNARKCSTPVCDVIGSDYPVSFNVLMNFDFTGDTHLLFSASPKLSEEYIPRCREWETYDTYSQTCRSITCNKFYTLVGDRCVPTQHDSMPSDGITDVQQLRSLDQTAMVSLVLNVTYADYLIFTLNNGSDENMVRQLADKLNISAERVKDVNVTFDFSSTNGTTLKVTTLTEEEYNKIFPPLVAQPDSTTDNPYANQKNSTSKSKNINEAQVNKTTNPKQSSSLNPSKIKSFWDQKNFLASRQDPGDSRNWQDQKRGIDNILNMSDSEPNENASITSREVDTRLEDLREALSQRKSFKKYVHDLKRAELLTSDIGKVKGFRKLKSKNDLYEKGLVMVVKNGSNYFYISEPFNNKSDRIVLQAEDIAAAAFMTGVEILDTLMRQTVNMRVNFVLVPPHDPHSHEDGLNALLQKIDTMIVEKRFSLKLNGNSVDVIDADDKSDIIANAEDFCPWGVEYMVYDDEFTIMNIGNQTLMYINKTNSYINVGLFDLWVMFAGNLAANETNFTGLSKYAFVCFMPRILQKDCNRIDLENNEYYLAGDNRSIIFEEREYDIFSYKVVNESTGKVQICVPQSFHSNMQTMLPHIKLYGGCSHDFDTALKVEGYMTLVLGRISVAALACVLITYCLFPRLRNLPGVNTMNLTFALLVAEVIFSEGINVSTHWLCSAVAISLHFTFLAAHFWMNVMSYDVYRTFANSTSVSPQLRDRRRYFPRYATYAWGVPMLVVAFCAFIDFSDVFDNISIGYGKEVSQETNFSDYDIITTQDGEVLIQDIRNATGDLNLNIARASVCWITRPLAALVTFGAPILLIFIVNSIFFARTILSISKTMKLSRKSITNRHSNSSFQKFSARSDVMLYVKMSTVMGFTWVFGLGSSILSSFAKPITYSACIASHVLAICFTLFNASQGVFIFIAFVCNRRVLALYCGLFRRIKRCVFKKDVDARLSSVSTIESNRNTPMSYSNRI